MKLNNVGEIIENIWKTLPEHHPVILDTFQIMPNHIHFIIQIIVVGGSRPAPTRTYPTLGTVVGMFKSACSKQIHIGSPKMNVWQRNYYEHIIRNENELNAIRKYIEDNPPMWERNRNNLNLKS